MYFIKVCDVCAGGRYVRWPGVHLVGRLPLPPPGRAPPLLLPVELRQAGQGPTAHLATVTHGNASIPAQNSPLGISQLKICPGVEGCAVLGIRGSGVFCWAGTVQMSPCCLLWACRPSRRGRTTRCSTVSEQRGALFLQLNFPLLNAKLLRRL